ncbi:citramalate synthase [Acidipropionibacterium jensenii]|uniref:citramalate synthase n=1 Tax=Acidipropionibacterium jensenii TaxID=1749 RepID=UPI00264747B8|nr:citramalate synthase [Acidipropionibacterium jensenii]MDN5978076.1 citramalate synthase [Acidipropionibacterium jensenii]MDN5997043.1 citramalate synthase [Acidipropionibacterium jensenii]MDN6480116.1 citramalate synthase [Acidipropionibacterium jensenii]
MAESRITVPSNITLFDTTLRDGAQQEGLRFSVEDKLRIAALLDGLGVGLIEGGWPGANPADTAFFQRARTELELHGSRLVAFGSTRRPGSRAADDQLVAALRDADTPVVCLVAKADSRHVEKALRTTAAENLAMIADTVTHLVGQGREVMVDCEHFFDGFRYDPDYALEVVRTAAEAGASTAVLCDTNGGMLPSMISEIVGATAELGVPLGIHCHNDTGCAVANSLAAVEAGASQVQGTINGYGERTGNADLVTLIGNLETKYDLRVLPEGQLAHLSGVAHAIGEIANQLPQARQPYAGRSSFAHKAGLHASAIRVDPDLYQHIDPAVVGNDMRMLVSGMSGRANVLLKASELGFDGLTRDQAGELVDLVKRREVDGYSYEAADGSFELLLRDHLGMPSSAFEVLFWQASSHQTGDGEVITTAVVSLHPMAGSPGVESCGGSAATTVEATGNGPVHALDQALRGALIDHFPQIAACHLTDYRVRILDDGHGTDATVRVLIDTEIDQQITATVGVGTDIIEASWEALSDAYRHALISRS